MSTATRTWTYADLDKLPEPENGDRYEIIEGELVVTAVPSPQHQALTVELVRCFGATTRPKRLGKIFTGRINVLLDDEVSLIPDLVFVSRERRHIVGPKAITGSPDVVVEILSPTNRHRDLGVKLRLYTQFGVREYWLVDPEARTVTVYVLDEGRFRLLPNEGGVARSRVLPDLAIDVAEFFAAAESW